MESRIYYLSRYSGFQWFMSHWRRSSDLDQTWSMWSVDIPKKAHWVKKIFFFPPEPPGGAQFFYYMEIEAAVLAMFEHESNFFFFCLKGDQKLSRHQLKKIWIGPFFDPFGPSFAKKHLYSAWPHGLAKIAIFFKTSKSSDNYSCFRLIMPISWVK